MFCAISGNVPEEPVVTSDGHVFEKRLVLKHLEETGRHPVTGDELKKEDLIPLQTSKTVKPRPSPVASIPGLLGLFHNEWDALMLETHSLQQSLHSTRQELAHALYQHDAACRVIARLSRERDEARAALEAAAAAVPQANGKRSAEEDRDASAAKKARGADGFGAEVVEAMTATSTRLSKARKARVVPPELASPAQLAAFSLQASQPLHKTGKGGIKAIDVSPAAGSGVVATGGGDGAVAVFDTASGRLVSTLKGHSKKINSVKFMGDEGVVLSASSDGTARIWRAGEDGVLTSAAVLTEHTAEVTAVTPHPSNAYFVTASLDKSWAFYDAATATCLSTVKDEAGMDCGITTAEFHPDGIILGTGCQDTVVRVWEARQQKNVAKFEGHTGPVAGMSFSENGYYLATCAADGVKLWDLRKLKNFRTLAPPDGGAATTSVHFDKSGQYLAVGSGADARVYATKQDWSVVQTFVDLPKHGANAVRFGEFAKALYVGCADHNLRTYAAPPGEAAEGTVEEAAA
mmetsp:Transcript_11912/g.35648  ORF Transcript_11912/g.35648 Transcript_11912/m.35648 type:complete len:519 (-) Transcript_11912:687-2243(-)|eukprot:CAMPEP_0206141074 /NCGR_PEP_ID=MMETSP1473-20131121/11730_1 /ASSEMBLY_ACC=CAM_ASM_001109 /TAXON_ID=1461547 /ORGANISM="Stichococcus sp, Strain RCC1054" /LENGTH=518 /DNA_ID=CAMNT_0053535485 /DNA_START=113 /DNA_END=1669 /DNA_ORIENTATION=-